MQQKGQSITLSLLSFAAAIAMGVASLGIFWPLLAEEHERSIKVKVTDTHITLSPPASSTGPTHFLIVGEITEVDRLVAAGRFVSRGVVTRPRVLNQLFRLDLPALPREAPWTGVLTYGDQWFQFSGDEPLRDDSIIGSGTAFSIGKGAVVGGTGRFLGVHGTYSQTNFDSPIPLGTGTLEFEIRLRRK